MGEVYSPDRLFREAVVMASPPDVRPKKSRGGRLVLGSAIVCVVALAATGAWLFARWPAIRLAGEARKAVEAGRLEEAEPAVRRWLEAEPGSAEAHFLAARIAFARERPQEALDEAIRAGRLGYPKPPIDRIIGILKSRAGLHEEAEPILVKSLAEADGPDAEVAEALARIYVQTFRLPEARLAIERWASDAPDDPGPYLLLAQIGYLQDARPSVLVDHYREAAARDPGNAEARLGMGRWLMADHRYDEAATQYEAATVLKPDDPEGHLGAGRVAFQRGLLDDAARSLDKALALRPDHPEALRERAAVDLAQGHPERALERIDRALRLEPHSSELHYRRGTALRGLGRADEANEEQQISTRLKAEDEQIDAIRRAVLDHPDDPALKVDAIRWMLRRDQEDEALKWAKLVLRDHPGHPDVHRLLADYYERVGDVGLANYYRASAREPDR